MAGQDDSLAMVELAPGKLWKKFPGMKRAFPRHLMEHHEFMLNHVAMLEEELSCFNGNAYFFWDKETFDGPAAIPVVNGL